MASALEQFVNNVRQLSAQGMDAGRFFDKLNYWNNKLAIWKQRLARYAALAFLLDHVNTPLICI